MIPRKQKLQKEYKKTAVSVLLKPIWIEVCVDGENNTVITSG